MNAQMPIVNGKLQGDLDANGYAILNFNPGNITGYVPSTRTINGHDLSTNIVLNSSDVGAIPAPAPLTPATKTKITYDVYGLVTSGADATTADIADSTNRRYVTDAQRTVIQNTSGANTGDQDLTPYQTKAGVLALGGFSSITGAVPFGNLPIGTSASTVAIGNHTHTFASLTSRPTTIAGYGITDNTFANLLSKPTTIAGYGITDFNTLGDARWSLLSHVHAAADITSGTIATARLGSGTANSTSFLCGDQTWFALLDGTGKIPTSLLPSAVLGDVQYQGTWNASTNTPTIPAASSSNKGNYYVVAVAGTTNISGTTDWKVSDWLVSNGTTWDKLDNTDAVTSVAGRTGAVTLAIADLTNAGQLATWAGVTPGTGVGTALAVNVGTAGAFVVNGGALGTPSSGTLTNCTFPTLNQNTTGSAATLTTPRSIYGNNFDGSAALSQIIASTYGGTGNGFTKFSGPATSEKTKTLRDANDTILELGGSYTPTGTWTSVPLTTPKIATGLYDTNGASMLLFTATSSAVNQITITNAASGSSPSLSATGSGTNIALNLTPKGSSFVNVNVANTGAGMLITPAAGWATGRNVSLNFGDSGHGLTVAYDSAHIWTTYFGLRMFSSQANRNIFSANGTTGVLEIGATTTGNSAGSDVGLYRNAAGVVEINNTTVGQWAAVKLGTRDSATTTVSDAITIGHQSTGTPGVGFGAGILFNLNSSTTADQNAGRLYVKWLTATHASRSSLFLVQLVNNAGSLTDVLQIDATGGGTFAGAISATNLIASSASNTPLNLNTPTGVNNNLRYDINSAPKWYAGVGSSDDRFRFLNSDANSNAERFTIFQDGRIRLSEITTPSSPANGDIWTDGTHIYCRIGGVSKQLD